MGEMTWFEFVIPRDILDEWLWVFSDEPINNARDRKRRERRRAAMEAGGQTAAFVREAAANGGSFGRVLVPVEVAARMTAVMRGDADIAEMRAAVAEFEAVAARSVAVVRPSA